MYKKNQMSLLSQFGEEMVCVVCIHAAGATLVA